MNRIIRKVPDAEHVSRAGAEEFVTLAREAIKARGQFVVALSGGSTPKRLFQILADAPFRDQVEWSKVQFFWGDERSVPPDHNDSNYRMAREALLGKLTLSPDQVHRVEAERADRDQAAQEYQNAIAKTLGVSPTGSPPRFDLILLGMGPDAHTASLFPGTTALGETKRWVVPNFVPKFNTFRLTFSAAMINQAAHVLFLVAGPDKAEPLHEVLEGPPDTQRLPSQLIRPESGRLLWLIDQAAAAKLQGV